MRQLFLEDADGSIKKIKSEKVNPFLDLYVSFNFSRLRPTLFLLPAVLLLLIAAFLFMLDALHAESYILVQREHFFMLNSVLSQYPELQYNLTETGNTLVVASLLSIFVLHAPKIWECLASALLVSCLFSSGLKKLFHVPRPAAFFDNGSFTIIGRTLSGYNSLPSGHSITIFTALSILMFAFMPARLRNRIVWCVLIVAAGLGLILTRVALGAHYPIDVIVGGIVGYICALAGIFISTRYRIWKWIGIRKYYPFFIIAFTGCWIALLVKIMRENLFIFYLSLFVLTISLYKITAAYVKR
ncbi:phosphatase PAP2 family protein [Flavobacterium plurextorum]|uniref:Phosphatase PAP2 family protein n=2 Tax=Flavobacterium TaxID=237 RepID=A0A9X1KQ90_9FLAO|nr:MULTISPECIES: phosphatase PAP2 family protein [Flavobacterium]MBW1658621.1 phosphatase PAP2 family protein [Flavobacterium quisquiliarum]MBZ4035244.1 phosphatase PAP2 family protein [Flavobacterium potami]WET02525.1 phosphatase PAP2 family protein [Flavobacterium sp. YJ01]